jgi:Low temperature viability protein
VITGKKEARSELENPIHYGVYFKDTQEYDYMQHMKPIGLSPGAVFLAAPGSEPTKKNIPGILFKDDVSLPLKAQNDDQIETIELDIAAELEVAMEDSAYLQDAHDDFFDAIVEAPHSSSEIEDLKEIKSEYDEIEEDLDWDSMGEIIECENFEQAAVKLQEMGVHDWEVDEETGFECTNFLEFGNGPQDLKIDDLAADLDEKYITTTEETMSMKPHGGGAFGKKERQFARAVQEFEALRRALKGVCILPTAQDAIDGQEQSDITSETCLDDLSDWNPDTEETATFSGNFMSLTDDTFIEKEGDHIVPNLPNIIREHPKRRSEKKKRKQIMQDAPLPKVTKANLGQTRPKHETPEEKKSRKALAKEAKRKITNK